RIRSVAYLNLEFVPRLIILTCSNGPQQCWLEPPRVAMDLQRLQESDLAGRWSKLCTELKLNVLDQGLTESTTITAANAPAIVENTLLPFIILTGFRQESAKMFYKNNIFRVTLHNKDYVSDAAPNHLLPPNTDKIQRLEIEVYDFIKQLHIIKRLIQYTDTFDNLAHLKISLRANQGFSHQLVKPIRPYLLQHASVYTGKVLSFLWYRNMLPREIRVKAKGEITVDIDEEAVHSMSRDTKTLQIALGICRGIVQFEA
ncbi:hypothetical protein EJ04DRAFT_587657, partial [Polyplosphaeria fusca]